MGGRGEGASRSVCLSLQLKSGLFSPFLLTINFRFCVVSIFSFYI